MGKLRVLNGSGKDPYLVTITKNPNLPFALRKNRALLHLTTTPVKGYKAVLSKDAHDS